MSERNDITISTDDWNDNSETPEGRVTDSDGIENENAEDDMAVSGWRTRYEAYKREVVECEMCHGNGNIYHRYTGSGPMPYAEKCQTCKGSGVVANPERLTIADRFKLGVDAFVTSMLDPEPYPERVL